MWKWFFNLMQIKLFARKVVHLASFWKSGFWKLGSGLLLTSFKFEPASLEHLTNPKGMAQGPQKSFHSFLPSTDTGKSCSVAFNWMATNTLNSIYGYNYVLCPLIVKVERSFIFYYSGASFFIIGLHASLLSTSDTPEITEELTMEEV